MVPSFAKTNPTCLLLHKFLSVYRAREKQFFTSFQDEIEVPPFLYSLPLQGESGKQADG